MNIDNELLDQISRFGPNATSLFVDDKGIKVILYQNFGLNSYNVDLNTNTYETGFNTDLNNNIYSNHDTECKIKFF